MKGGGRNYLSFGWLAKPTRPEPVQARERPRLLVLLILLFSSFKFGGFVASCCFWMNIAGLLVGGDGFRTS